MVLYYQQTKMQKRLDTEREMKELAEMRAKLGIDQGARLQQMTSRQLASVAHCPVATRAPLAQVTTTWTLQRSETSPYRVMACGPWCNVCRAPGRASAR